MASDHFTEEIGSDMDPEEAPAFIALQERKNNVEADLQNVIAERDDLVAEVPNLSARLDREEIQGKQHAERSDALAADVLQCAAREVELATCETAASNGRRGECRSPLG